MHIFDDDYCINKLKLANISKYNFQMWVTPRFLPIYENPAFEGYTSTLVANFSKKTDVFIDVGAHYGYYSLLVKASNPKAKVIALEPVPENFEILSRNIAHNNVNNVEIINKAISNDEGSARFNISLASDNGGFTEHPVAHSISQIEVQTTTLGKILAQYSQDKKILLKIDTEGHEIKVLEGMEDALRSRDNIRLIIEYNPKVLRAADYQPELLIEKMTDLGYDVFFIDDDNRQYFRFPPQYLQDKLVTGTCNLLCIKKSHSLNAMFFLHSGMWGGSEKSLYKLVKLLIQNYGCLCTVVLPRGEISQAFSDLGAALHHIDYSWWCKVKQSNITLEKQRDSFYFSLNSLLSELPILKKNAPDVISTNSIVIPWGAIVAAVLDRPHVWMVNEFTSIFDFIFPFEEIKSIVRSSSNQVITRSEALKNGLFGNTEDKRIDVIYLSVDVPSEVIKKKTGVSENSAHIIFPGTIMPSKGQKDAVLALAQLTKLGYDANLILAGSVADNNYFDEMKEIVRTQGLENRVSFLPFTEDIWDLYHKADIVLVPSRSEGFGRVVLEAMLLKIPIVATNVTAMPELIPENHGLLYSPGDIAELVEHIRTLIDNQQARDTFVENAFLFAKSNFSDEKFGGHYNKLFFDLKSQPNALNNASWIINSIARNWQNTNKDLSIRDSQLAERDAQLAERDSQLAERDAELYAIKNSRTWRVIFFLGKIRLFFIPKNSWREKVMYSVIKLVRKK